MKNEYKVTKALMQSWAKEYHLRGAANIVLFALWCLVGVLGLATLALSIVNGADWLRIYISAVISVLAVYRLFFARFVIMARRYRMLAKTYGVSEWIRSIEFWEDEIVLRDHTSLVRYSYAQLSAVKEKGNCALVLFKNNTEARLYKDAFTEGDWESCRTLLNSKIEK